MPEYYWTIIIEDSLVQASIWTVSDGEGDKKVKVVCSSTPTSWENNDDLVVAADTCLSECVQDFPEDSQEPSKTVFGVPADWVSDGNIKPEHLDKIKTICSKLSLQPSGFVVLPEALAYWVKSQEDSPLSGIVIGIDKSTIEVSLFKLGNLLGTVNVSRSISLVEDVVEGLARFPQEDNLPSRMLLYDGKSGELDLASDAILQADWLGQLSGRVKFLHTPKVESIHVLDKIAAVSLAGASEITGVTKIEPLIETVTPVSGEAISDNGDQVINPEEVANVESLTVDPRELGFALGEEVKIESHSQMPHPAPQLQHDLQINQPVVITQAAAKAENLVHKAKLFLARLKHKLPQTSFLSDIKTPHLGGHGLTKFKDTAIVFKTTLVALIVVLVGLFAAWWFLPKAHVVIYVSPKKLTKTETITIDTTLTSSKIENKQLSAKLLEKSVSGEKTTTTTGTKTVGERAKGKVQIRNGTSSAVKLTPSSVITSSSGLKFNPDNSASISAATSPTSPGTAIIDVTASDIGSDYNLAKGETFKVGNYPKSDVDAVADMNFSGGSSRDIQAVSENDREGLEEKLTEELKAQAESQLEVAGNQILIDDAVVIDIDEKTFNHKVGDEASEVKLSMSAKASAPAVIKSDVVNLARKMLENDVPSGFALRDDQIQLEFKLQDEDDGVYEVELVAAANLLPEVKPEEVAKKIKGKYPKRAQEYLSTIAGYQRVEIEQTPSLPGRLGTLPRILKNITIEIAAEK